MDAFKLKAGEPATGENLIRLAATIDQFEQYTRPHASQLARHAEALAMRVGMAGADLNSIKLAALLHDIGELAIDTLAVRVSGPIDFKQRIELWRHPIIGEQQLAKRGLSRQAQLLVRWHHEWWNGLGYPDMLAGEAIPLGARILRLVDTYDALLSTRPYREAYPQEQAFEIIAAHAGLEFDPWLVKIFFEMISEMNAAAAATQLAAQQLADSTSTEEPAALLSTELSTEESIEPPPPATDYQLQSLETSEISEILETPISSERAPIEPIAEVEQPDATDSAHTADIAPESIAPVLPELAAPAAAVIVTPDEVEPPEPAPLESPEPAPLESPEPDGRVESLEATRKEADDDDKDQHHQ